MFIEQLFTLVCRRVCIVSHSHGGREQTSVTGGLLPLVSGVIDEKSAVHCTARLAALQLNVLTLRARHCPVVGVTPLEREEKRK